MTKRPALTLVELILTISVVAILSAAGINLYTGARQKYALKLSTDNLVSELQRVHIFSRENKEDKSWGIKIVDDRNYQVLSRDATSETVKFRYTLTHPVSFSSGTVDIWFDQVSGTTPGNISLQLVNPRGDTKTITVTQYGLITSQ